MKYSICIEMIFNEQPFYDRIGYAKDAGFDYCEFWSWTDKDLDRIKDECHKYGVRISNFCGGQDHSLINPKDNDNYISFIKESISKAKELDCKNLIILANAFGSDTDKLSYEEKIINLQYMLKRLAAIAEKEDICLVIEPLNTIKDHKGYFLDSSQVAFDIVKSVGSTHIKVLYDVYHMQIMEGNIIECLKNNIDYIGYIHIADVPGRHEPGTGELNYENIFKTLDELNYDGVIGLEFNPTNDSKSALESFKKIMR